MLSTRLNAGVASLPPRLSEIPPYETVELDKALFAILDKVLLDAFIVLFVKVCVPVFVTTSPVGVLITGLVKVLFVKV